MKKITFSNGFQIKDPRVRDIDGTKPYMSPQEILDKYSNVLTELEITKIKEAIKLDSNKVLPMKGWRSIMKEQVFDDNKPLDLNTLKVYLKEIFIDNKAENIAIWSYCPHQDKIVILTPDPKKTGCVKCNEELASRYEQIHNSANSNKV